MIHDKLLKKLFYNQKSLRTKGFTLIELLVVIALIGTLAGVAVVTINPEAQQNFARDGVRRQHLKDTADSLETYYTAERSYPAASTAANKSPLDSTGADKDTASAYIKEWPSDIFYMLNSGVFSIYIEKASEAGKYYKYNSTWKEIRECTDVSGVNSC